jgi:hypothetical protein
MLNFFEIGLDIFLLLSRYGGGPTMSMKNLYKHLTLIFAKLYIILLI